MCFCIRFKHSNARCSGIAFIGANGTGAYLEGTAGGTGLGKLEGRTVNLSEKGINKVENHLAQFGDFEPNAAMIERLKTAHAAGESVSGADAVFYTHELAESTMMGRGVSYEVAHPAALTKYEVSPFSVYHPDVIAAYPEMFGPGWFKFWGITMKKHFKLNGLDEVTIWCNETPIEAFLSRDVMQTTLQASLPSLHCQNNELVIELKQPRGPRCLYGLLGAKFHRSENSQLNIRVGDGLLDSRLLKDSMIAQFETPRYGLPDEVANHVLKALVDEIDKRKIQLSGTLDVCFGAYGDISSSTHVFKLLARALPSILLCESLESNFMIEVFSS